MSRLAPLQLDDGSFIYVEASDEQVVEAQQTRKTPHLVPLGSPALSVTPLESRRVGKGWRDSARVLQGTGRCSSRLQRQQFRTVQHTLQGYTQQTLSALGRSMRGNAGETATGGCGVQLEQVTLEFGIQLSGGMGVPYITKGTTQSNVKVTVQCSFSAS